MAKTNEEIDAVNPRSTHMSETMYRASRYFRVLGNPTAYLIVRSLEQGPKTPGALGRELGRTVTTVSKTLRHLRQVNLVRYETKGVIKEYRLKDKEVLALLEKGELLANKMRSKVE